MNDKGRIRVLERDLKRAEERCFSQLKRIEVLERHNEALRRAIWKVHGKNMDLRRGG